MHTTALVPVTGSPSTWARDLAFVGGVSGIVAPGLVIADPLFSLTAGLAGALLGAMLGAMGAPALEWLRPRAPLWTLVLAAPIVGAGWGALSGVAGGLVGGAAFGSEAPLLGAIMGAGAGMVQLGWMFLPYMVATVLRLPRWPVLLAASGLTPMLGWIAVSLFFASPALLPLLGMAALPTLAAVVLSVRARAGR